MPGSNIIHAFPLEPCNHIYFLFLTEDPRTGDGVTCGIGSFGFGPDGSLYRKTGAGNTDWTIALDVPGDGGVAGGGPVVAKERSVTLTHADLTGPIASIPLIVPAAGAGKIIVPIAMVIEANIVTPYAADAQWKLWSSAPADNVNLTSDLIGGTYLTAAQFTALGLAGIPANPPSLVVNKPIVLAPDVGGSPLTDGDPANTARFSIAYYEHTVAA